MEVDLIPAERAIESPEPQPKPKPKPSYAPFFVALGVTMAFWGLATSLVMSAGGFLVFAWGLWSWIRDIAQAWRNSHARES
jgi:hypothetical protein